jgi:predicted dehydrogenase
LQQGKNGVLGVGLVGYGYWGPNLARNFSSQSDCRLVAICEKRKDRAELAQRMYRDSLVTDNYDVLLSNPDIQAILIATPVSSHYPLAKAALEAGKDILVEKPLVVESVHARELVDLARQKEKILAVDHTFLFTGAVQKIKKLADSQDLGQLLYFDSVRVNLGLFQPDVSVIYDLAPHDISILCHLMDQDPIWIQAMGASFHSFRLEHHAYLHMEFPQGFIAHFHLSWLAPVKVRRTIIGGTKKMLIYDDLEPTEKVKVYDKGVDISPSDLTSVYAAKVEYRTGDMLAPKVQQTEALQIEAQDFLDSVKNRTPPLCDGEQGLRVVRILEAARRSLEEDGRRVFMKEIP